MLASGSLATVAGLRLAASPPPPSVVISVPSTALAAPGSPPPVTLPPQGGLELDSDADGRLAGRDAATSRPIASVAKTMTAHVVLQTRPLEVDQEGPVVTMTQADVDAYRSEVAADGSAIPVTVGERLTERQLLLALMLPSANNIADTLARWLDGGAPAFVARLNAAAVALGMAHTHFADASGFSPLTTSTPADLVRLGRAALAQPALARIVGTRSATLPDGTELHNLDTLLSTEPGWLGLKTGSTPQAGGCLLFAARRPAAGGARAVTVVGAVLGQVDRFAALDAARRAVNSAFAGYVAVDLSRLELPLEGEVHAAWGATSGIQAGAGDEAVTVELRQGAYLDLVATADRVAAPIPAGSRVGDVAISRGGRLLLSRPVVASRSLAGPGLVWRLLRT